MASNAYAGSDLLALQAKVKTDPEGYKDEFLLQYRHFMALLEIFQLKPSNSAKEFGDLAMFMAQVVKCYPEETSGFAKHVMDLLDTHYAVLDSALRRTLVQSLILLRNRNQLEPLVVLPLFFRLFRCQDKQLRTLLFRHIVSDIKTANKGARNDKLNRALQSFMYGIIQDDNESAAKKSLAVCTELWRRHVWRDARTVNVIASATFHKSPRIMLAVLKFFLGQDAADEGGSDVEDELARRRDQDEEAKAKAPSKHDIYNATKKGTHSSQKKKKRKIARVQATVKKAERKGLASHSESFAAVHLLHDPQSFAERLFARMQSANERFETRLAMIQVLSRIIGVHKLLVLNFYAYLQKYIAGHQRDVTIILAALVTACHEVVPPDVLQPVLKQLVDSFVHDRARPEVATIGIKTVRELCLRAPLVMSEDLLQDLALYRKDRNKEVSNAAKGLISLFREINPAMLAKRDRGRGADMDLKPKAYGESDVKDRVDGAELLEAALAAGQASDDDDYELGGTDDDSVDGDGNMSDVDEGEGGEGEWEEVGSDDDDDGAELESGDDEGDEGSQGEDESESEEEEEASGSGRGAATRGRAGAAAEGGKEAKTPLPRGRSRSRSRAPADEGGKTPKEAAAPLSKTEGSLSSLKKQLAEAKARKAAAEEEEEEEAGGGGAGEEAKEPQERIEAMGFLSEADFERIKRLKQKQLVEASMSKHGLKTLTNAKRRRLLAGAEEEAEELTQLREKRAKMNETRILPDDLKGNHKKRKDKMERLESVLAGRVGREEFGSSTGRKKGKTGGLTEKEKQKKKAMPSAARDHQIRRNTNDRKAKAKLVKNFKGHVRGTGAHKAKTAH
ncbi:hypothetical protein FOA52_002381 [Chlamydomonas sp. UWO 241]|nr:hypothetical protein FOA52_002381 [Chlamydomonas sp. UWO 241]